ncbi:hypothetical protein GLW04_08675 [Halobacillus litoralis]|uniref:Uncharacterized protein n=1 Tax=Halobacillus litoralis TaxID=45668 RepID=A0A845DS28_9BACI|nr:hypothetical protein [Halobacillus litoralis]MYL19958.1 hypothetical protein [Halobacillus litoralis]
MINQNCSICGFTFAPNNEKEHRSFHQRYLFIQRKFPGDVFHPSKLREIKGRAISLIENDYSQDRFQTFEGGELLAHVEFTKYLLRTRNYISFEEFMDKQLSSQVDRTYLEDILFFWEEAMRYRK